MSTMQTFRDGLRAEQSRLLWKAAGLLGLALCQLALVVIAFWYAWHDNDYARATFYAVLYLWASKDSK